MGSVPRPLAPLLLALLLVARGASAAAVPTATLPAVGGSGCDEEEEGKQVPPGLVLIGTIMTASGSVLNCVAVLLQKRAHDKNEELPSPPEREEDRIEGMEYRAQDMLHNWRWWLGILCMVGGAGLDMAALPFVPMSRVAVLGSITIILNILITPLILGDVVTLYDIVGCTVVTAGTTVAVIFGSSKQAKLTPDCLLRNFDNSKFWLWSGVVAAVVSVLGYYVAGFRRMSLWCEERNIIGGDYVDPDPVLVLRRGNQARPCGVEVRNRVVVFVAEGSEGDLAGLLPRMQVMQVRPPAPSPSESPRASASPASAPRDAPPLDDDASAASRGGSPGAEPLAATLPVRGPLAGLRSGATVVTAERSQTVPMEGGQHIVAAPVPAAAPGPGWEEVEEVPDWSEGAIDAVRAAWHLGGDVAELRVRHRRTPEHLDTVWLHDNVADFRASDAGADGWRAAVGCCVFVYADDAAAEGGGYAARACLRARGPQFYPIVHAAFSGVVGAQSVFFAKGTLLFLSAAARGEDVGKSVGLLFGALALTLACLYVQIFYLNVALRIYPDAIFVLPCYQALWIGTGCVSGLTFYKEYEQLSWTNLGLFWAGLFTALTGLLILAMREHVDKRGRRLDPDDPEASVPTMCSFGEDRAEVMHSPKERPLMPAVVSSRAGSRAGSLTPRFTSRKGSSQPPCACALSLDGASFAISRQATHMTRRSTPPAGAARELTTATELEATILDLRPPSVYRLPATAITNVAPLARRERTPESSVASMRRGASTVRPGRSAVRDGRRESSIRFSSAAPRGPYGTPHHQRHDGSRRRTLTRDAPQTPAPDTARSGGESARPPPAARAASGVLAPPPTPKRPTPPPTPTPPPAAREPVAGTEEKCGSEPENVT